MNYWDTSALLKLYVSEPDSTYFVNLVSSSSGPLITSEIARIEIYCALSRKQLAGELGKGAADLLSSRFHGDTDSGRIITVPLGADVFAEAIRLTRSTRLLSPPLLIRSLDALHVATALVVGAQTAVATDSRLRAVAASAGLVLLP